METNTILLLIFIVFAIAMLMMRTIEDNQYGETIVYDDDDGLDSEVERRTALMNNLSSFMVQFLDLQDLSVDELKKGFSSQYSDGKGNDILTLYSKYGITVTMAFYWKTNRIKIRITYFDVPSKFKSEVYEYEKTFSMRKSFIDNKEIFAWLNDRSKEIANNMLSNLSEEDMKRIEKMMSQMQDDIPEDNTEETTEKDE